MDPVIHCSILQEHPCWVRSMVSDIWSQKMWTAMVTMVNCIPGSLLRSDPRCGQPSVQTHSSRCLQSKHFQGRTCVRIRIFIFTEIQCMSIEMACSASTVDVNIVLMWWCLCSTASICLFGSQSWGYTPFETGVNPLPHVQEGLLNFLQRCQHTRTSGKSSGTC
jgi:hypothetical protein